jgi:hypothetical protein
MLKYNIRKRKHWVHPFFLDSFNSGAYIVSKELNQDPDSFVSKRNSFSSQIYFVPPSIVCVAFVIYTRFLVN